MFRTVLLAATCLSLAACADAARQPAPVDASVDSRSGLPEPALALAPRGDVADFLSCLRGQGATIVSAHRGGPSAGYPENAIETMAHRLSSAPMMLEIDVRQTSDGTYVLFHDDELDADTDGTGPVSSHTMAELSTYRYDEGGFAISTLEDVLEWARGRAILQLDVKPGVAFSPLLDWLSARDAEDRALIITYNARDAATVARESDFLISASVGKQGDLADLAAAGVPADRITAWTGLGAPKIDLWRTLGEEGISANYGAYATLDEQAASADAYAALGRAGLHILSSDRPTFAYEALQRDQDFAVAARRCMG
ncbi:glycerophosphodiester phosphodiesterase family protein [Sphingomicrobium sp. XHP0235]|uniref:glycerophosphodiester phosphodiesterase family protein n=1 Tax=Sphingomicrobium aquimarinum TaxID=3133971 RepID=UPI0031FF2A0F